MVGREVGIPTAGFALFGFYYHEACLPSWMQNLCPLHLPACASLPLTLFSSYSLVAQMVKNLPAMWKICIRYLGQEGPLEKGMATHSSILAWRIPWTEEPGELQPMGWQRVKHD